MPRLTPSSRRPVRALAWAGRLLAPALALGLAASCAGPAVPPPAPTAAPSEWFADATEAWNLTFRHAPGPTGDFSMARLMGSGVAAFDADGDGRLDALFLQNAGPGSPETCRLYLQREPGRFTDATAGSGLDVGGFNMGVAVGDVNGDGRPDVVVTQFRGVKLFVNQGGGRFRDESASAGVASPYWGTSASFFDYDLDGRLDLVVVNYVEIDDKWSCVGPSGAREFCGPNHYPGSGRAAKLFRNVTPPGGPAKFEDVSLASGLGRLAGNGLGVYCADFTGDGYPDILVANDGMANRFWVNQKNGTFVDEAAARGFALTGSGVVAANMGVAVGDIDNDGLLDVFVTHLGTEMNTLWRQNPRGQFADKTLSSGAATTKWRGTGFGAVCADFDLDGRVDLALTNGRVTRGPESPDTAGPLSPFWRPYGERNQLLRNVGGKFADASEENPAFCGAPTVGRGLAWGDFDGDGRPDLLVNAIDQPGRLYLNRAGAGRHWLGVLPQLPDGSPALGSEVTVTQAGRRQVRVVQTCESYLSVVPPEALFGLGDDASPVEVRVLFPGGKAVALAGAAVDKRHAVRRE